MDALRQPLTQSEPAGSITPFPERKRWGCVLTPDSKTIAILDEYFLRTTLFWNYCVDSLSDLIQDYIVSEPRNPTKSAAFKQKVADFFEQTKKAYEGQLETGENPVSEGWAPYLEKIFELPDEVLLNRLNDLVSATNRCYAMQRPSRKTKQSKQTIRIDPDHFSILGNTISIAFPTCPRLSEQIEIPQLERVGNFRLSSVDWIDEYKSKGLLNLTITRENTRHDPKYGPLKEEDRVQYTLSLHTMDIA